MRNAEFLDESFFRSLDNSTLAVEQAQMLPMLCYTERDFFEFETAAIFTREWLCVGREAWAPNPGDFFTTSHIGEPIVVVRNRDGVLHAFSTVCQHRAMLVAEGRGNTRAFICPYHHWTYSLDGQLIGAPAMERTCDFDPKKVRLGQFKLEVWLGFIFVNFDLDAPPLAPRLETLRKALEHWDLEHVDELPHGEEPRKCPWNWKVQLENSNDGYHANRLHKGPVHDLCPSDLVSFPELPPDSACYFRYNGTADLDVGFNPTRKAILPIFPQLTLEERHRFLFANVPPSFQLFARPDWVTFTIFQAEGPQEMTFQRTWMVAPGAMKEPLFKERLDIYIATSATIGAQDRHVDAMVQTGLRSRFANRGRYSWQETAQLDLNKWLVTRYKRQWDRMTGHRVA